MQTGTTDNHWREKLPPICTGCGYNLTGLASRNCPECGQYITWSEVRANAKVALHALREVEDVNDVIDFGVYLGAGGLLLILVCYGLNFAAGTARVFGFLLGLATLGAGLQVLRVRRFPEWSREFLTIQPKFGKAVSLIFFALGVMALAVLLPKR
jgi:predicted RNA-binding Zn-ribbon protein involved in translation (DUF1610 family)